MSGMLLIDRQHKLFWLSSNAVFNFTVYHMAQLMKEVRPDIANEFLDSDSEIPGMSYLNIEDYSLADKEYVLTILIEFRRLIVEHGKANPGLLLKYDMPDEWSDAEKEQYRRLGPQPMTHDDMDKKLAEFESILRQSIENMRR